ncbi:MAG TPA: MmgE/PrpD family protein [Burkholderiales bacterium]|nr:MmgE/PrpD family protein [Burkholderiales bacterium]
MRPSVVSPVMRKLSAYVAQALRRPLPPAIAERAKHHLLDTIAAMFSGAPLLPGRRAIEYIAAQGGVREATVIGSRVVTTAVNAALANGMLAHADETDDAYYLALVHPGCAVVPAALAMAERERRGGTALLRAVVVGYDVCARISKALGVENFRSAGFSTHSYGGLFGAAAAAGALAGLDADRCRYLLSYAAQQASGLSCWARDTEHIEKAFDFGGMPARNGVAAATMVASGFSGVEDVFSGDRGFFHAHARWAQPQLLVEGLGRRFDILQTAIKRWPVGYPIQAPLDALSNIIAAHRVPAKDVERVVITIDEQGARTVNARKMADINVQHLAAMMLVDGEITFASSHDAKRLRDPAVAKLRMRIELAGSAELSRAETTQAIVEVTTKRGERHRHHTRAVRGSATNPMSRAEVAAKASDLLIPVLGRRRAARLIETVWRIERVSDARSLRPLLRA